MAERVNMALILSALQELSDQDRQERLWLSDGKRGQEVSSPVEVLEALFGDSGLGAALDWSDRQRRGGRVVDDRLVFSHELDRQIVALGKRLQELPDASPRDVIESDAMGSVRAMARTLHASLLGFVINPRPE